MAPQNEMRALATKALPNGMESDQTRGRPPQKQASKEQNSNLLPPSTEGEAKTHLISIIECRQYSLIGGRRQSMGDL